MTDVRGIFFDAGGTLLTVEPSFETIYAEEAAALGAPIAPEVLRPRMFAAWRTYRTRTRVSGPRSVSDEEDRTMWREVLQLVYEACPELEGLDPDRWYARLEPRFRAGIDWVPYRESHRVLERCRAIGLRVGVVSNWSTALHGILERTGLADRVDRTFCSATCGAAKPDVAIFRRALRRCDLEPAEVVHVGDTWVDDVLGARAAGLRPVFLDRSGRGPSDGAPVVEDLEGIFETGPLGNGSGPAVERKET